MCIRSGGNELLHGANDRVCFSANTTNVTASLPPYDFVTMSRKKRLARNARTLTALIGGWIIAVASPSVAAPETFETDWLVQRYADPMHKAGVVASTGQESEIDDALPPVSVVVRCWSATNEIDVRFMTHDGRSFTSDEVRWQFDRGANRSARWRLSPRGNAMVVTDATRRDLLQGMRNGKELVLFLPLNQEQRYRFSLAGSSRSIGEIQTLCPQSGTPRRTATH